MFPPEDELAERSTPKEISKLKREKSIEKYLENGWKLYWKKRYKKSIEQFKEVLKIDPAHKESIKYIKRAKNALKKEEGR